MKKIITIAGIVSFVIFLAVAVIVYHNNMRYLTTMTPLADTKVPPGIWALKNNYINAFVRRADDETLEMIDAERRTKRILKAMKNFFTFSGKGDFISDGYREYHRSDHRR